MPPPKKSDVLYDEVKGRISGWVGTGPYAQSNTVFVLIILVFITGILLSLLEYSANGRGSTLASVESIWTTFLPLITLALGYLFGERNRVS